MRWLTPVITDLISYYYQPLDFTNVLAGSILTRTVQYYGNRDPSEISSEELIRKTTDGRQVFSSKITKVKID